MEKAFRREILSQSAGRFERSKMKHPTENAKRATTISAKRQLAGLPTYVLARLGVLALVVCLGGYLYSHKFVLGYIVACVWRITDFPRINNSPHTYMDRSRAQHCFWSPMSDDPVAVIYSASLNGG
jgi:hypothetical protein